MANLFTQFQNLGFQLKSLVNQYESLNIQMMNMGIQNIAIQIQFFGIQILNLGVETVNIGIEIPNIGMQLPNISQKVKEIGIQLNNIGNKIDMQYPIPMNMNMANFGIQNQNMMMNNENLGLYNNNLENNMNDEIWNLIFEKKNAFTFRYTIRISKNSKILEAIKIYKRKSNNMNKDQIFLFNGQKLNPNEKICESELRNHCNILVFE